MSGKRRSSIVPPKDQTRRSIVKMEAEREERRRDMLKRKKERAEESQRNIAAGNPGDVDFIGMVRKWRQAHADEARSHDRPSRQKQPRICVTVRKRPLADKERAKNDHDSVTVLHPTAWIHSAKFRVDGITKYLDHTPFRFDHAFDETVSTDDVYEHTTMPLVDFVCSGKGGRATVFAYGQTGSGKTHTMTGIQERVCEDLFLLLSDDATSTHCCEQNTKVMVSFFELYAGVVQDLLNDQKQLKVWEDGKGEMVVPGLLEIEASDPPSFLAHLEDGYSARKTQKTEANDTSSRSHAIFQIMLRDKETDKLRGKLSLVDLAGSERGDDTRSHNAQRIAESADINSSLLALKECIRALGMNKKGRHVPYRNSMLTRILKDCFSEKSMTTMIATVSPGASAADHSINTLRYADRIKEQRVGGEGQGPNLVSPKKGKLSSTKNRLMPTSPIARSERSSPRIKSLKELTNTELSPDVVNDRRFETVEDSTATAREDETAREEIEEELRETVKAVFEQEEAILSVHMSNIQENAELLAEEGKMLQLVQKEDVTAEDIEQYVSDLELVLDRKEEMICSLQDKLDMFQMCLQKEQDLGQKLTTLS